MRIHEIRTGDRWIGLDWNIHLKQMVEQSIVDKVVCLDHFGKYVNSTRNDFQDHRRRRMEMLGEGVVIERGEAKYHSVITKILSTYRPEYIFHLATYLWQNLKI